MAGPEQWDRLGWQGISMEIPADWCPGRLEGDYANGYLRVEDELSVRLELRWESLGRRAPTAAQLVDRYLRATEKKIGRRAGKPRVDRGRCIPQLGTVDHEAFTWRGGFNAHSLLVACAATRRVVHVRVFFAEGDELKDLTRRVFASVRTAPEKGLDDWSVFGLGFRIASSWRLEKSALWAGRPQLLFGDGRDELEVARVSLAEILLRRSSLGRWFEGFFAKVLGRFRHEVLSGEYCGHPAVRCGGALRVRASPLGLFRRPRHLTALAWHCAEADKIFVVRAVARVAQDPQVQACADTIACH